LKDELLLNISNIEFFSKVLGPGIRNIVWFQGCHLDCKGCINPHMQSFSPKNLVSPIELFDKIIGDSKNIEGITITGGEPFLQPKGLNTFLKLLRNTKLSIQVYTGFYLIELIKSGVKEILECLEYIDVLIDGPYDEGQKSYAEYRGSLNQNIHFFTDRYTEDDYRATHFYEYSVNQKTIKVIGFYNNGRCNKKSK